MALIFFTAFCFRMVPELVSFVILLVVFILAYGLASQALINPTQVLFC